MQEEILKLDENILPKEIQKIIGNEYLFQLHLDEYNLKYGKENYTVSKILEMEISHKQNDSRKVEEHQDTMEEIVRKSRKDKFIASQKIEKGETSVERPEKMPLQMLQKHQKVGILCLRIPSTTKDLLMLCQYGRREDDRETLRYIERVPNIYKGRNLVTLDEKE
nr:hypothetical protein CFP56_47741 [Quercus suber]